MPSKDLIEGYLAWLREESHSDRTIDDRDRILNVIDRQLPYGLDGATADELKAWLWREGLKLSTRETYYGAFAGFFKWAETCGHLDLPHSP
jgi:integrase/recombinase XerC